MVNSENNNENNCEKKVEGKYLIYKGKPLVREGNIMYYGKMSDPYILFLMVMSYKKVDSIEIPERVLIQVLSTDKNLSTHEKIYKQGEKTGLYDALDVGTVWLERALG